MRVLLLATSLITACFSPNEAIISQSAALNEEDLTSKDSPAYIETGECLIDIQPTLALNTTTNLSSLGSCLPSSKLSWLFKSQPVQVTEQATQRLKLAVLLDTSHSLRKNDPQGQRYKALRTYLLALHKKITTGDSEAKSRITSAEIQIYPFKYCDKRKNKEHKLEIDNNTAKLSFTAQIDELIGDENSYANAGSSNDIDKSTGFEQLTQYGAYGSTNYLHSLAKAIEFFGNARSNDLKQVLIFSDGLPFTFNDDAEDTIDLSASGCDINNTDTSVKLREKALYNQEFPSDGIKACVTEEHYPKNTCARPTSKNKGQTTPVTSESRAWSDPLNHVLGMAQHSTVINNAKVDDKFQVYAVLLKPNNCNSMNGQDQKICENITLPLAKPFFESFADSYEETSQAGELAEKLEATLNAQTRELSYHHTGTAMVDSATVDGLTKLHEVAQDNFIKVGRDKKQDTVYDYANDSQATLIVEHGVYTRGGDFEISYDFEFPARGKGEADCRSSKYSKSGDVEVNEYSGRDYTAWCLLSPRCDEKNKCCDAEHQEITAEGGQQICASKEGDRIWIGFDGNRKVCACECDDAAVRACQGAGQSWNTATCTCETSGGGGKEACVPSNTVCCKNGTAYDVSHCDGGKTGNVWDSTQCRCVQEVAESPPENVCDRSKECCDSSGAAMTPQTCVQGKKWEGFPACRCVPQRPRLTVTPPTNPAQTEPVPDGKQEPENPEKAGKEQGGEEEPPPAPAVTEGIIWGDFESF